MEIMSRNKKPWSHEATYMSQGSDNHMHEYPWEQGSTPEGIPFRFRGVAGGIHGAGWPQSSGGVWQFEFPKDGGIVLARVSQDGDESTQAARERLAAIIAAAL